MAHDSPHQPLFLQLRATDTTNATHATTQQTNKCKNYDMTRVLVYSGPQMSLFAYF